MSADICRRHEQPDSPESPCQGCRIEKLEDLLSRASGVMRGVITEAEGDIYTDAPECAERVERLSDEVTALGMIKAEIDKTVGLQEKWAVDLPDPSGKEEMIAVGVFETREAAIAYAKKAYGADDGGNICLVSSFNEKDEQ